MFWKHSWTLSVCASQLLSNKHTVKNNMFATFGEKEFTQYLEKLCLKLFDWLSTPPLSFIFLDHKYPPTMVLGRSTMVLGRSPMV